MFCKHFVKLNYAIRNIGIAYNISVLVVGLKGNTFISTWDLKGTDKWDVIFPANKDSSIMTTPAVGILYNAFVLTKKRAVATSYVKTYGDILFSCGFDCHEVSFTHVDTR